MFDDGPVWVTPAALFLFCAILLFIAVVVAKKAHSKADEEEDHILREGMKRGILNDQGQPVCVIDGCTAVATKPTLRTGKMWVDKVPIVQMINDLTDTPEKYAVEDDMEQGPRLCVTHYRSGVRKLKQAHAKMRSDQAEVNAIRHTKIHMLEQGGLEQAISEELKTVRLQLGMTVPNVNLLDTSNEEPTSSHILTASSEEEA